ncbi:MAG: hypothetical protein M1269_02980 [Chloroflexi bacterium]|nr:hypothetical protein [Chloroflexota bacterium]
MAFWEDLRTRVLEHITASDIAFSIKKKLATTEVSEIAFVKPAYYLGQLSVLTMDFIDYTEKLLDTADGDKPTMLELLLYVRECAKSLALNVKTVSDPLEIAIQMIEEIYEGEELADEESGVESEPGPMVAPPEGSIEEDEDLEGEEPDDEDTLQPEEDEEEDSRENFELQRSNLEEKLIKKLETVDCSKNITEELASSISNIYLECVQHAKDLARLAESIDGDLPGILSVLVDIQYGLDFQLRGLLLEDVEVEEEITFVPGMLTWSSLFLNELTENIIEEY